MNEQVAALMAERAELIATKRDQIDGLIWQLREATAAKDQAVLAERERCARLVEDHGHSNGRIRPVHRHLADAIRTRLS